MYFSLHHQHTAPTPHVTSQLVHPTIFRRHQLPQHILSITIYFYDLSLMCHYTLKQIASTDIRLVLNLTLPSHTLSSIL